MALTVSEKQHWKERIARKISQAIADLLTRNNPKYLEKIEAAARIEAVIKLGVFELIDEQKRLTTTITRLEEERGVLIRQILADLRGIDETTISSIYGWEEELERVIKRTQKTIEQELLAADELGRQVLKLRREEEELLDTVWLATSPVQIRTLWQSVSELAGEITPLQQQALSTPPPKDSAE